MLTLRPAPGGYNGICSSISIPERDTKLGKETGLWSFLVGGVILAEDGIFLAFSPSSALLSDFPLMLGLRDQFSELNNSTTI